MTAAPDPLTFVSQLALELDELRQRVAMLERSAAGSSAARKWLTLDEAATQLACSRDAVRMRVNRGRLEYRRQGRRLYVSAAAVESLA